MAQIEEAELLAACRSGSVLDGRDGGDRRPIDAALLRRFCRQLKNDIDPRGIRVAHATVVGQLDLAGLDIPFPLSFDDCEFDAAPVVEGAQLFGLSVTRSPRLPGLLANGLRVRRDLDLSGSLVTGAHKTVASTSQTSAIWLCESDIGGRLLCIDTVIDGLGGRTLQADRVHVGGTVRFLHSFSATGEVRLIGARIDGSLDLVGAHLDGRAGAALDLGEAAVEGSVFIIADQSGRRPVILGQIDMARTRISGLLLIRDATLEDAGAAAAGGYARSAAPGCALRAPRLSVGAEVALEGQCLITGSVDLSMSELSGVTIGGSCVLTAPGRTALNLTNAELGADLRLEAGSTVNGTVRLPGAVIHGALVIRGTISSPERRSCVGATALVVDGDVDLSDIRVTGGRVNFRSARLGSVHADGARLDNPGGYTLSLNQTLVQGSVRLVDGFTSTGLVVLNRCTIDGRLVCTGGSFACPGPADRNEHGHAIEAISATVRGGMDLGWSAVTPSVDFTDATTTFLADDPATWPDRFTISGFRYERFEQPQGRPRARVWDQGARCAWLGRQSAYDASPYEQAARVFRQHGYAAGAEEILMAQRRGAWQVGRTSRVLPGRLLDGVFATIGYGYRPWRVLWALATLLVLVVVSLEFPATQATLRANNGNGDVYSTSGLVSTGAGAPVRGTQTAAGSARPDACGDGEVRCFNPVLYAVDTVVPLISLDQRSTWYPDPHATDGTLLLWWLNAATLLGWLLSSIFVLSLARLARSP